MQKKLQISSDLRLRKKTKTTPQKYKEVVLRLGYTKITSESQIWIRG